MHGNFSLLNLDLAQHWQQEEIAKACTASGNHSRFESIVPVTMGDIRQVVGSSLISIGERLRPVEREKIADDAWEDSISINLARQSCRSKPRHVDILWIPHGAVSFLLAPRASIDQNGCTRSRARRGRHRP